MKTDEKATSEVAEQTPSITEPAKTVKAVTEKKKIAKNPPDKSVPAKVAKVKAVKVAKVKAVKPVAKVAKVKAVKPVKVAKVKAVKPASDKRAADNFNRDFGKMRFNGQDLPKGRTVLAVIKKYHEDKKPTSVQLKAAFPGELLPIYGMVVDHAFAKKANASGKKRYFDNEDQLIKCKDGETVAIANQFSNENIKPFIKHARSLGYNITSKAAKTPAVK